MKTETKSKLLVWAVVFLALLNISTISTIFIDKQKAADNQESFTIDPESSPLSGRYLRRELNFDQSQMETYRIQSRYFRNRANGIISNLNHYKAQLNNELNSVSPDSSIIADYSDSIGISHAQLKKVTAQFYLGLKGISDQEQTEKLEMIFAPLFRDNPNIQGPGRGTGRGRHH